ncbi:PREDICTED: complement component C8 alpha chain [Nanorana parkeri]|uniref:complement component C8 alpha chain n=1 Tax=Nanorana parkeri TaxID=125878 RepID=UPI0008542B0A|nr:PREDICTED: complement component C8 alpha chain [Nanorana parkeri]
MNIYVCASLLVLCSISSCVAARDEESTYLHRSPRSADTPAPVDCRLGPWSDWTQCFPCQGSKQRYRNLAQPAKYGGRICVGTLWESIICQSSQKCVPENKCGKDFQCEETGRCIKRELVCNGENECRDLSDEKDCEESESNNLCKQLYPIPGAERAVRGFNILTQEDALMVLDPTYFGGQCEYVYNGDWREQRYDPTCEQMYYGDDEKYFRKPYNFQVYQFLTRADTDMSFELYEDSKDLLNAIRRESSSGGGASINIRPAGSPVGVGVGFNVGSKSDFMKNISSYTGKNLQFARLVTKVETARFRMRRNSLVLDEDMLVALMELPDTYNYGPYARFINDYGTHFVTAGTVGGILENVLVFDTEVMKKKDITYSMVENCIGSHVGITSTIPDSGVELGLTLKGKTCKKLEAETQNDGSSESSIKDVITFVKGGDTGSAGGLSNIFDGTTYRFWGQSLKYSPTVIEYELLPIHEGLKMTDLSGIEAKRQNLKKAYDEFLSEFNSCRCGPCENNGEPILDNNQCSCHCPAGYEGPACERTQRPGTKANGNWGCWSSWSSCQSGTRQRSRTCNNPPPKNGGAWCVGKSVQSQSC